ncbi:multiple inositol polyphosphate phosphatase 1 isoform X2 [Manduca sexta]|nr:multiple inositol polyphosphate phosphatase 1 isoform X2 [Manduca sexta]
MKAMVNLKNEIIASYDAGRGQMCAQDIDELRRWNWNDTMDVSQSFLTGTGYEELYDIAKRIRQKYPHLLEGSDQDYYFRPTNEQRTITSAMAFVHGLTDGTNLTLQADKERKKDEVIRPYENCDRYQEDVKNGQALEDEIAAYHRTAEYVAVQNAVQQRLGITTQLSTEDVYSLYELCRFYRSWTENLRSPWCAAFTEQDLVVLEYRDDVRHYHRNGYGSWVNVNLGAAPLRDLYKTFEAVVENQSSRKVVSYFTHDTMLEMVFCAMGIFKDATPLRGATRDVNRLWRTSYIGAFSVNIIAVLNRCGATGPQSYRVQIFINEKPTELCPLEGCSWQEFMNKFQPFLTSTLDFCSRDYRVPVADSAGDFKGYLHWLVILQIILIQIWRL